MAGKKRIRKETFAVEIRKLLKEGRHNRPHVIHPWREGYQAALKDIAEAIGNNVFEEERFVLWAGFDGTLENK